MFLPLSSSTLDILLPRSAEFEKAKLATEPGAGEEDARDFTPAAHEKGDIESQRSESVEQVGDYKGDTNSEDEKKGDNTTSPTLQK